METSFNSPLGSSNNGLRININTASLNYLNTAWSTCPESLKTLCCQPTVNKDSWAFYFCIRNNIGWYEACSSSVFLKVSFPQWTQNSLVSSETFVSLSFGASNIKVRSYSYFGERNDGGPDFLGLKTGWEQAGLWNLTVITSGKRYKPNDKLWTFSLNFFKFSLKFGTHFLSQFLDG